MRPRRHRVGGDPRRDGPRVRCPARPAAPLSAARRTSPGSVSPSIAASSRCAERRLVQYVRVRCDQLARFGRGRGKRRVPVRNRNRQGVLGRGQSRPPDCRSTSVMAIARWFVPSLSSRNTPFAPWKPELAVQIRAPEPARGRGGFAHRADRVISRARRGYGATRRRRPRTGH